MSEGVLWVVTIVTFALGAFYSGSETALIACDRIRIRHLANQGDKRAHLVLRFLYDPEYFLSAVLVGTNLAVVGCTATFTAICTWHFGTRGDALATVILVPVFLIFNEIIPKGLFLTYANRAVLAAVYPLRILTAVLFPVVKTFNFVARIATRLLPGNPSGRKLHLTMEELLFHISDSGEAGLIPRQATVLAKRAVELMDLRAGDVMTPLSWVEMVAYDSTMEEFRQAFLQAGYSRMPVFGTGRGDIRGILSVHGLMQCDNADEIRGRLLSPYTTSFDTPVVEVLFKMKERGRHMCVIRDEAAKVVGITTLEDILEKLVGAIEDEFN